MKNLSVYFFLHSPLQSRSGREAVASHEGRSHGGNKGGVTEAMSAVVLVAPDRSK